MQFFNRLSRIQWLVLGVVVAVAAVLVAIYAYINLSRDTSSAPSIDTASTTAEAAVPEDETTSKGLLPELPFSLPSGSVAIDEYAFTTGEGIYFRSLTGKNPLQILNADAPSFSRLSDFSTYAANGVASDCGGNPIYTYYGDKRHVYFYQIWRTPTFRTSQIEVVVGTKKEDFDITDSGTATNGTHRFEVGHMTTASSTCLLMLTRTQL